jgi:FG-GAP-like repeat
VLAAASLCTVSRGQEYLWTDPALGDMYFTISPFGDYDGDGSVDLLVGGVANWQTINGYPFQRVLSGVDGSILFQSTVQSPQIRGVGDMDGDGLPEYAALLRGLYYQTVRLAIVSPARNQILWSVHSTSTGGFGFYNIDSTLMADLDLNGDGMRDLVVLTSDASQSDVYAYDNTGTLLYTLPVYPNGWASTCAAMPDMDGDGCDDFLVGVGSDASLRGYVALVSGRTGAILRITTGQLAGNRLGGVVADAGDVDGDGVHDYVAASHWNAQLQTTELISGATGAILRSWNGYWSDSNTIVGNVDLDQDGVPDLVVGNAAWPIQLPVVYGQIRTWSGRDGGVLWNLDAQSWGDDGRLQPSVVVSLGVQPGSPYPVFAFLDISPSSVRAGEYCRIRAVRTSLPGTGPWFGSPGGSNPGGNGPDLPCIGMRQLPNNVRITVAFAPPGAIGWLAIAGASETTLGGASLPIALDPLGWTGCTAYVPPTLTATCATGTLGLDRGYAAIDLPVPTLQPAGIPFAAQWLVLDPTTGACATTARHEFRIW